MIRFSCKSCGRKFKVSDIQAGKKGKCPGCQNIVYIPGIEDIQPVSSQPDATNPEGESKDSTLDPNLLDIPQENKTTSAQEDISDKAWENLKRLQAGRFEHEPLPERKLPWIIDILLYPANFQGMIFLAIAVLVPLMLQVVVLLMFMFGFLVAILNGIIVMYIYWFMAQCIRSSAEGQIRAPETIAITPGLWELIWQAFELFACFAVCAASAVVYFGYMQRFDVTFWLLAGGGAFLYPMALLAVVMFDSINGLNPLIIIPSVFSVFFRYCGLVVLIAAIIFLYVRTVSFLPSNLFMRIVLSPLVQAVELYLAMVAAHLLGRFYFKYQEKLNWEV